jgi:hypothetical protein
MRNLTLGLYNGKIMSKLHELKEVEMSSEGIFAPGEGESTEDMVDDSYISPEMDDFTPESFDEYLSAQVVLPMGESYIKGEVIRQKRDHNG